MQVLDLTIANVSLPTISGNLGGSANQATWVITSFAVSNAIALPLTGWLTRHFGERKLFVWATALFVIASLLCGLANSMGLLVAARALQGFVAGPMYPITQALLISIYPPHKRGQAIALLAMVTVVAPIAGPDPRRLDHRQLQLGMDLLHQRADRPVRQRSWSAASCKGRPERLEKPKMDYVGLITLVLGVGALQILLDLGNDEDWFRSHLIVRLAIVSAISLAVFVIWETHRQGSRSSTCACSATATSARARRRWWWRMRRSSASASWCRCGCSATSDTRRSGRASPPRRSASCR